MKDNVHPFAMTREDGATRLNQLGFLLLFLPAIFGAQEVAGYGGDPDVDRWFVLGLCILGGALGGLLFALGRAPLYAGLLGGALASTGGMVLIHFWIAGRERFFFLEAFGCWMVGCIPGALIYQSLIDRASRTRRAR